MSSNSNTIKFNLADACDSLNDPIPNPGSKAKAKSKANRNTKPKTKTPPTPLRLIHDNTNEYEIGIDEAGRGPMFGRLYVAGVVLPKEESFDIS